MRYPLVYFTSVRTALLLVPGTIVQTFRLSYPAGAKPEPISRVTLRSEKGIFVRFTPPS